MIVTPGIAKLLTFEQFVNTLQDLNRRSIAYIVSYDGRTESKQHGLFLPDELKLRRIELAAGSFHTGDIAGDVMQ